MGSAAECVVVGNGVALSIDPEDAHGRKSAQNALTLLGLFNITFGQQRESGFLPGRYSCTSETVRSSIAWNPNATVMHDRPGEFQGTFSCATAGLYALTVAIDGMPIVGGAQQILIVPDKAFLNNTLAQLADSPGWCVESDEGPRCRTMPGRSNKIVIRVRDVYGNERRRSSLQEGPAGDVVTWRTRTVGDRPCEDCHLNATRLANWEGDVLDGFYSVEFSFGAKIEHEVEVVMTMNGQSWGALSQDDMQPSDRYLRPALRGISRFRYALHTNLDPRACEDLNCSNSLSHNGVYPMAACHNAGCTFTAGAPTVPNRLSLILDWDRRLLGNVNITVTRDACSGPSFDPSTGQTRKPQFYWEQPHYCEKMRANATDIIQCGHPLQPCVNVPPVWIGSSNSTENTSGIVEIVVNHPGLFRVNVETTSALPASSGGGQLTLRLPTRQLSIGPGPADHAASTVRPAAIHENKTTSGSRTLGRYELDKPGEGYNFSFSIVDSQQNPRVGRDELVVEVTRVDPQVLRSSPESRGSAEYQPELSAKYPFNITYTTAALRRPVSTNQETDCKTDTVCTGELKYGDWDTGVYTFNQSLVEFGVYSVKAWVCTQDTLLECLNRAHPLSMSYTFTVCPQNTDVRSDLDLRDSMLNGTIAGAVLDKCQCQAGFKSPAGIGENCNACDRGQFQTSMGKNDCHDCVAGTYCGCASEYASVDSTKCGEMAWNPACSLCDACPPGQFQNKEGQGACRRCRDGFDCSGAKMTFPIALPGHWVNPRDPREYYECKPKEACLGTSLWDPDRGQVKSFSKIQNWQKRCTTDFHPSGFAQADPCFAVVGSQCKLGYTSGVFGGTKCDLCCRRSNYDHGPGNSCDGDMWRRTNGFCVPCEHKSNTLLALFVIVMMVIVGPVAMKVIDLSKHLGALHGPVMSVVNFFQTGPSLFLCVCCTPFLVESRVF
jgi:hypothetical protein